MQIVSINVGEESCINIGGKNITTGIFKKPCVGPVFVSERGVAGDTIVNTEVHGGEDQAVYLYSMVDYQWWSEQLGRELGPGSFGENLTLSAFPDQVLRVGDRLKINSTLYLEITAPRVPCAKLATKMGDLSFGKKFAQAVKPGVYARVLIPATVSVGDPITWEHTSEDTVRINDIFIEWHKKDWSAEFYRKALQSPISKIARRLIENRLAAQNF